MKLMSIILSLLLSSLAYGLAIDEKLSVRVLKVSDSRKTVLANRGLEDGLVVGDHAKFYLTKGVVARGVIVKASPTRSVWSMYRVINANDVAADRMMNLKISKPIKFTDDMSKMISNEDIRTEINGIPLAAGARDLPQESADSDRNELASLGAATMGDEFTTVLTDRDWELWGTFHINSLTSVTSTTDAAFGDDFNGQLSIIDFSIGLEIYFDHVKSFFHRFSISPFIHKARQETSGILGRTASTDILEYGAGLSWHLNESPFALNRFIWFVNGSVGIGDSTENFEDLNTPSNDETNEGSLNFFSAGLGIKYYVYNGFGARFILDYYSRTERYTRVLPTLQSYETTKQVAGPRIHVGLSYRW